MSRRSWSVAAALVITLLVTVAYGTWLDWDWKAMTGWQPLVDYIDPKGATGRKDAVQVYAVIVAGVIASITAAVGLLNLRLTRKNLEQQRELETQRAQGTALQAYYAQIGRLITDEDLRNTKRKEIRELARGQTVTVVGDVDGYGKGSLLTFLRGAGLIEAENPAVRLVGANLQEADLQIADFREVNLQKTYLKEANLKEADFRGANLEGANLEGANLKEANLQGANLQGANLQANLHEADLKEANLHEAFFQGANLQGANLQGANLQEADLQGADLREVNLREANLRGAKVSDKQLADTLSLQGATMPDGSNHP